MVGARGFEPPASWSRTTNTRIFKHLAVGTAVVKYCALLRVIKWFRQARVRGRAMVHNASLHRVGTKMGKVRWATRIERPRQVSAQILDFGRHHDPPMRSNHRVGEPARFLA